MTIIMTILFRNVFQYSNSFFVFFVLWLFVLSLIFLGCLVSSLFSKAKTAGFLSIFILFAFYLPYFAVQDENISISTRGFTSLLSPVAFSLTMGEILKFEGAFIGVQWDNWNDSDQGYSIQLGIFMCAVDTVLYAFFAWYNHSFFFFFFFLTHTRGCELSLSPPRFQKLHVFLFFFAFFFRFLVCSLVCFF